MNNRRGDPSNNGTRPSNHTLEDARERTEEGRGVSEAHWHEQDQGRMAARMWEGEAGNGRGDVPGPERARRWIMATRFPNTNPAAELALAVRNLAAEAHRLLTTGEFDDAELEALAARVGRVRQSLGDRAETPV